MITPVGSEIISVYSRNMAYASSGCVLEISIDRDDQRNFLGLEFSFPGFLGI